MRGGSLASDRVMRNLTGGHRSKRHQRQRGGGASDFRQSLYSGDANQGLTGEQMSAFVNAPVPTGGIPNHTQYAAAGGSRRRRKHSKSCKKSHRRKH